MGCRETKELLTAFHDGELPTDDRARVEEHLRGCRECDALLTDLSRADRAAGVPDPGPAYWDRFNARVMERLNREGDVQGWTSAEAGRDAPGVGASAGAQRVLIPPPKHGWMRQQLRYLVPAAAVAALVVAVVRFEGMHPNPSTMARDGQVPGQAGMPPISEPRPMARDGQVPGQAGMPPVSKPRSTALSKERFIASAREERERMAEATPIMAERPGAGAGRDAPDLRAPADGQGWPSVGAGRDASDFEAPTGQGRPSAGAGRDATGIGATADGQGWPSAGAGRDATGFVAPAAPSPQMASRGANEGMRLEMQAERKKAAQAATSTAAKEYSSSSPCDRARTLAERKRFREAEEAQRACLAGKLPERAREKGLVFLAELLDRQARFADADAVIAEVDRRFPQSLPLDLYRQQRPLIQKRLE